MAEQYSVAIGDTFNRWTYLGQDSNPQTTRRVSLFRCSCGTERFVNTLSVVQGRSKSCGCQRVDSARNQRRTHGRSQDGAGSAYLSWANIFARCFNPNANKYKDYGGRGITVCERWHSFENFLADMGERPLGTTIDRWPNNNGNYEPGNCRWATPKEQMFNTRSTHEIKIGDQLATTADLAKLSGVSVERVRYRIARGATAESAMDPRNLNERVIEHNGLSMSIAAWERHLGLNRATVETRLRRGDSVERALRPVKPTQRRK